jgi:hypothetical protein
MLFSPRPGLGQADAYGRIAQQNRLENGIAESMRQGFKKTTLLNQD